MMYRYKYSIIDEKNQHIITSESSDPLVVSCRYICASEHVPSQDQLVGKQQRLQLLVIHTMPPSPDHRHG